MQQALALEPGNPVILGGAGGLAWILGRFDEAIALHRRAIEIDPLRSRMRAWLGRLRSSRPTHRIRLRLYTRSAGSETRHLSG